MTTLATTWSRERLADVADLSLGKMLDQNKNRGEYLPYLANVNVRWGSFDLSDLREMRFESHERVRYGLQSGDIVMCEGGEPGRCALWKDEQPGMMIQKALHRIRARDGLDNRFLYYSLLLRARTGAFASLFTGATIKHLPSRNLSKIEVILPPPPIQARITNVLSTYDHLIDNSRRRILLLEQAARLLYEEWFAHFRFPGHQSVRIVDGVPTGWKRKPLADVCKDVRNAVDPKTLSPDTAYIGLEHIPRRSITLIDWASSTSVDSTKFMFIKGDILFGKIRPYFHKVGFTLVDGVTSSDAIVVRPTNQEFYEYLLLLLSSDRFVSLASKTVREGSKMPRADWKFLLASEILVPEARHVGSFKEKIGPILDQLRTLALTIRRLTVSRDLLLPRLMNGELEP